MSHLQGFLRSEPIEPGQCVLTSQSARRNQSESQFLTYCLAVICTESMLPTEIARAKPEIGATAQDGPFPVWLIGKSALYVLRQISSITIMLI